MMRRVGRHGLAIVTCAVLSAGMTHVVHGAPAFAPTLIVEGSGDRILAAPLMGGIPDDTSRVEGVPEAIGRVWPEYPRMALEAMVEGTVIVEIVVAKDGGVAETRVVKSVPMLDGAAEHAARQWKFRPALVGGTPIAMRIAVPFRFTIPSSPHLTDESKWPRFGDAVVVQELPAATTRWPPPYPPEAIRSRVQGTVIVQALVVEDGTVADTRIVQSIPLLNAAAQEAVLQWRFRPAHMNGLPIAVWVAVPVRFTLH